MSFSTMSHRRKAATYGRASRKPILSAEDSFASAHGTDVWNVQDNLQNWTQNAAAINTNSVHVPKRFAKLESLARPATSKISHRSLKDKSTLEYKHLSVLATKETTADETLFEVPSSEDDRQQRMSAPPAGPRKRKRISREAIVNGSPIVYDDASLQRHIAAEVQNCLSRSPSFASNAIEGNMSHYAQNLGETKYKRRRGPSENRHSAPKVRPTRKQKILRPEASMRDTTPTNEAKAHPSVPGQANQPLKTKISPRKVYTAIKITLNDVAGAQTLNRDPTRPSSSAEKLRPPKTPHRPIKYTDGTTTPRQRELWNKLLADDAPHASPSTIDLPGLILTDKKVRKLEGMATARKITWDSSQGTAPKTRPRRIIDTLHPYAKNEGPANDNTGEEPGSSNSDDSSDSIQSEASALNGAVTVQTSPSADSQSRVNLPNDRTLSSVSQPVPILHVSGSKVTYARQRSYLTDNDMDEAAMLSRPVGPETVSTKGIRRRGIGERLPKSQSMQGFEEGPGDNQDHQGGTMRSVHELREAGGYVRLASELEAMLDDIEEQQPASITFRRTRLTDLVAKLQEPSNCRLFVDRGLETRLLDLGNSDADLITSSLLAAAILQLIASLTSTILLSQISNARVVEFLIGLLEFDQNLASQVELREFSLSKYAQQEYRDVCASLLKSAAWRAGKPPVLSCHVLALQCLEYLVRQTRESRSLSEVFSAHAIRRIVASSIPPPSIPLPQSTAMSKIQVELAVSILESCTISNAAECQESLWEGVTLERVIGLLPLLASWKEDECGTSQTLTLRLYVNLTNNSPSLCEDFSTPEIVEEVCKMIIANFEQLSDRAIRHQRPVFRDNLILSLGALVNLAESSSVVCPLIMDLNYGDQSYLRILLELFTKKSKSAAEIYSEEEISLNVALGYLSVLLGFLCLDMKVRAWVSARLQGGTPKQLVDALEEFLQYYRQIGQEVHQGELVEESKSGFVSRIQGLVQDLKG